jgi:hypothetical protein
MGQNVLLQQQHSKKLNLVREARWLRWKQKEEGGETKAERVEVEVEVEVQIFQVH